MRHTVSLIIPALNEALRLPPYLADIRAYYEAELPGEYEVIVVDDGSWDGMPAILRDLAAEWGALSVARHAHNRGKGAAIVTGMLAAQGDFVLFADADGATSISEEKKLRAAILGGADVAIGSRLHPGTSEAKRFWSRGIAGRLFAGLTRWLLGLPVRDTQCGFKMFRRAVGVHLCQSVTQEGFLFDVEILLHAHRCGHSIVEIPVAWTDVPGSKVRLFCDGWKMFRGVCAMRYSPPSGSPVRPRQSG